MLNIICFGDSNTFGYLLEKKDCYPEVLKEIFHNKPVNVLNKGINGDTIFDLISRLQNDVVKNKIESAKNLVLVQIGTNDTDFSSNAEEIFLKYDCLMDKLISNNLEIWAITVPPRYDEIARNQTIKELNTLIKISSKPKKVIDFWSLLTESEENHRNIAYLCRDKVHLTPKACKLLSEVVAKEIIKEFSELE